MRNYTTPLIVLLFGLLVAQQSATAKTIHVSPAGNDAWTGQSKQPNADRTDGPVATLNRARDIIRQWKSAGPLEEPVRVVVADGVYAITEAFVLTPQDSGTASCPITYESAPGASPVISGGRIIDGFQPDYRFSLFPGNCHNVLIGYLTMQGRQGEQYRKRPGFIVVNCHFRQS